MIKKFVFAICCLLFAVPAFAQNVADIAMKQGLGVRAMGMGSAYSAVADDASADIYNPAGLAVPGLAYSYGNLDAEQKQIEGNFDLLKLGYLGHASWKVKDAASNEVIANATGFGNRSGWLNWGVTFKSFEWAFSGARQEGWSGDIGFLARITPNFNLALALRDLFTSSNRLVPGSARLGASFAPMDGRITLASDVEFYNGSQTYGYLGLDLNVIKGMSVRGGLNRSEPTAGLSLDLAFFSFDYSAKFLANGQTVQQFESGIKFLPKRQRPFSIIKPKEYALIDVGGHLKGGRDQYSFLGGYQAGLDSLLGEIRRATSDSAIDGIMLKISGFEGGLGGMAIVQELRGELKLAKAAGKKVVAYVEGSAVGDEYYLASIADKIVAPPGAAIGGFGKSISVYRYKGLYKKFGLEQEIFRQGKYKDAFDPAREKFSPEQEAMVKTLLADLYRQLITDIAQDRKLELSEVKAVGDGMIFSAKEAKEKGLVDEIGYYKDAKAVAAEISGDKGKQANVIEPKLVEPEEFFLAKVFGVAVIEIDGELVSGKGGENYLFGGRYVGSESIVEYIKKASDDMFVKAIILRINSPGGDAVAAGEIYQALEYAKKKEKVLIASIGNLGASGGYYIAAGADKVIANPSSLTGSIGVIGHITYIRGLLDKLDVETETVKEGKHADMFSGLRKMTPEEVESIRRLQKESYDEFINAVAKGRKMSVSEVEEVAQGQIYTGNKAKELNLVDQLGGFSDAVELAKGEAKIVGEPRLIFYHQSSSFFNFGQGMVESLGFSGDSFWQYLLSPSLLSKLQDN